MNLEKARSGDYAAVPEEMKFAYKITKTGDYHGFIVIAVNEHPGELFNASAKYYPGEAAPIGDGVLPALELKNNDLTSSSVPGAKNAKTAEEFAVKCLQFVLKDIHRAQI